MASRRRQHLGTLRSGHITSDAAATVKVINIRTTTSAPKRDYRFYNTGEADFSVYYDSMVATDAIPVKSKSSLDLKIDEEASVIVAAGGTGIYEEMRDEKLIRPGRFKFKALTGATTIKIVDKSPKPLYRILNSGKKPFDVKVNGAKVAAVKQRHSIDVASGTGIVIEAAANDIVEGIYDYLDIGNPIRSGRFKTDVDLKIIDIANATGVSNAYYRILNSDEATLQFRIGATGTAVNVLKDQSIDFVIDLAGPKDVWVKPASATPPVPNVRGIYEFLGAK